MTCQMQRKLILPALFFISSICLEAQISSVPPLERRVTIYAENKTLESVLDDISAQAGFVFSYSPGFIDAQKIVSYQADNKPVRLVLANVLDNSVTCKTKGRYVILQGGGADADKMRLEGYLYDSRTGEWISNASVYDRTLMASAVTDRFGYFSIELSPIDSLVSLQVSKSGYADTSIITVSGSQMNRLAEISMHSRDTSAGRQVSAFSKILPSWLIPENIRINSVNIKEIWPKSFQLSFVPGLSTNRLLGGNAENRISLNILGGYSESVRYFELGGLFNIVKNNSGYCQIGGISNFVGGDFTGLQLAGINNSASSVNGVQAGGIINYTHNGSHIQLAGIANKSAESILQISGITSSATDKAQVQIAGIANNADSADVQIGGIINCAGYLKTLQISLINIADTSCGISIGLINIVKNGYHKIEFSTDEVLQANIAFRSGTKSFHGIITAGMAPFGSDKKIWGFGYGIGTTLGKSGKTAFDFDLSATEICYGGDVSFENNLNRVYAGIDCRLSKKFSIAAGLTFNLLVTDTQNKYYGEVYSDIAPYNLIDSDTGQTDNIKSWIGIKLALRFL